MAQNAKISALTDQLIQAILKPSPAPDQQAITQAREIASRIVRNHSYIRTNQFDVQARYAGLDEKFRVKNRDDLADALKVRLNRLEHVESKFKPEFLSLLLQLADRPLENTELEALRFLRHSIEPPTLTWLEILREDPYSDDELWQDVDFAAQSDDEKTPKKREKAKVMPPVSIKEDEPHSLQPYLVPLESDPIARLEPVQFWMTRNDKDDSQSTITELQAIRETLFMLSSLSTSLYQVDQDQRSIFISSKYILGHAAPTTVNHLLLQFAATGKMIYRLREWLRKPLAIPLIQTFEATIQIRLSEYDQSLASLQCSYLVPDISMPVSLLQLYNEIQPLSVNLLQLARLVSEIGPQLSVNPFTHLEVLFDQAIQAQMMLDEKAFEYMARIFFDNLQTYLKPIRRWMKDGELGDDDETFFIFLNDSSRDLATIWHDRYVLRCDNRGKLRAPEFLRPASQKIFNAGKAVILLKELNCHDISMPTLENEPRLSYDTVCSTETLLPFPEMFQAAFENWISCKYSVATTVLRRYIFEAAKLMQILVIFETLYLGRNGAVFQDFADAWFLRIDSKKGIWNDRYILSEIARGVFSTVMSISEAEKIVVRSTKVKSRRSSVKGLAVVVIDYALPWCVQNIIQRSSIPLYQQVFTFLLQLHRVKFLLQRIHSACGDRNNRSQPRFEDSLRHRFIWFVDTVRSFLTESAIFFISQDMRAMMEKAEDIDQMSLIHANFMTRLQERAMLTKGLKPIQKAILKILDLGVYFMETIACDGDERKVTDDKKPTQARKSEISPQAEHQDSESEFNLTDMENTDAFHKLRKGLFMIDKEFNQQLQFIIAGLKSAGRVSAEPILGQLAEKLE